MTLPYGLLGAPQAQPTGGLLSPDEIRASLPTAPIPDPPMSLLQHLEQRIMAVPQASQSLLSGSDVDHARRQGLLHAGMAMLANSRGAPGQNAPGFGQAVAAGLGAMQQGFQGDMANTVQQGQLATQIRQGQAQQAAREAIQQKYSVMPADPEGRMNALLSMASEYANAGLTKEAGDMAQLAKAVRESRGSKGLQQGHVGDKLVAFDPERGFFNPETQKWELSAEVGYKPGQAEQIDARQQSLQQGQQRIANAAQNTALRGEGLGYKQAHDFITGTKDMATHLQNLDSADKLIDEAVKNPNAFAPALTNLVAAVDAKPQLRFQMLKYFEHELGNGTPGQRWDMFKTKLMNGTLPPDAAGRIHQVIATERASISQQYQNQRAIQSRVAPRAAPVLPTAADISGQGAASAPVAAPAAALPPLTPAAIAKAAVDPAFKKHLTDKGYKL